MIKPIKIINVKPYEIVCEFNNGEVKKINMEHILKNNTANVNTQKLLTPDFFVTVALGELGQLYWNNTAKMKDAQGNYFVCEYDVSPEFIYFNSVSIDGAGATPIP